MTVYNQEFLTIDCQGGNHPRSILSLIPSHIHLSLTPLSLGFTHHQLTTSFHTVPARWLRPNALWNYFHPKGLVSVSRAFGGRTMNSIYGNGFLQRTGWKRPLTVVHFSRRAHVPAGRKPFAALKALKGPLTIGPKCKGQASIEWWASCSHGCTNPGSEGEVLRSR